MDVFSLEIKDLMLSVPFFSTADSKKGPFVPLLGRGVHQILAESRLADPTATPV